MVYERDTPIAEKIAEALTMDGRSGMTMDQIEAASPSNQPCAIKDILSTLVRRANRPHETVPSRTILEGAERVHCRGVGSTCSNATANGRAAKATSDAGRATAHLIESFARCELASIAMV
jgi:hypothetical protein